MRRFLALCALALSAATPPDPTSWQIVFRDNFDTGSLGSWLPSYSDPGAAGWQVERDGAGYVLSGQDHAFINLQQRWWDYRLSLSVKLIQGSTHINFRHSGCDRYFIALDSNQVSLNRTLPCDTHTRLTAASGGFPLGTWQRVDIIGIGPRIRVFLDGNQKIDFTDDNPVLSGSVSVESSPDSHVHVDDVEINSVAPLESWTWVKTGGPLGGIGYDVRMAPDNPDLMYVTDNGSGVNVSSDGGRSWRSSNEGILSRTGPSGDGVPIFCLTVDPNNPNTLWAGTQNTRGIYKSNDGGRTWSQKDRGIAEGNGISFRGFAVDPQDSRIVYAAAEISSTVWAGRQLLGKEFDLTRGVIYKTSDGGDTWKSIWRGDNLARYVWIDPRNSNVIYASTGFWDREAANTDVTRNLSGGLGILKSVDGGTTWRVLNQANGLMNLYLGSLFMHPQNPDVLVAGAGHNIYKEGQGVYLTTNGGETWENVLPDQYRRRASEDQITAVEYFLPDPRIAYATSQNSFYRSNDGGRSWILVSGLPDKGIFGPPGVFPGQPSDLQVDPRNGNRVFVNNYSGGNFLSEDGGATWTVASRGYTGVNLFGVAVDPSDPLRAYAAGRSGLFRSDDGGANWLGLNFGIARGVEWYSVAPDPLHSERVLCGNSMTGKLLLSENAGLEWRSAYADARVDGGTFGLRHGFKAIAFAPSNTNVVYAGMARDERQFSLGTPEPSYGVFKSADGGKTWREANDGNTATRSINTLAVDPKNESVVYAGTPTAGILVSRNGGASWSPVNFGLRLLDVRALAIDPKNPTVLYAGVEGGGAYKSTDAGLHWNWSTNGMDPGAMIRSVVVDPTDSDIVYAGDLRTGVYRSENGGQLWVQVNKGLRTRAVKTLALSADGGTLYAATEGEGVFRLDLKPRVESTLGTVSAASFTPAAPLAPESIAAMWGQGLADLTAGATVLPLPTELGGARVLVTDSNGADREAPLFFVSAAQINFLVPAGTAPGAAMVRVFRQNRVVARGTMRIEPVAPGLFTADASGSGVPAAVAVRYPGGIQLPGLSTPVDLGAATDEVFLLLFGTGIRGGTTTTARIGDIDAPVAYAGPQGGFVGLDQVNVKLPRALAGRGEVDLVLTVDGKAANTVRVRIK